MSGRVDEAPDYGVREDPVFGAFFACDHCDGEGSITIPGISGRWDEEPGMHDREEKCPRCLGFGTVYVEEGC